MQPLLKLISLLGLSLTIIPAVLVFTETIELPLSKTLMLVGTLLWFCTAPFWMNKEKKQQEA